MAHSNKDKENGLSLEKLFIGLTEGWFEENFKEGGFSTPSWEGIFSPALTIWLMLLQRFKQRRTLVGALENLIDGDARQVLDRNDRSKKIEQGDISANTGGFGRARQRLSLEQVISIAELIGSELTRQNRERGLWRGRAAYLIDGTMITLPRTQSILKDFPTHTSGDQEPHCPQIRCLCMHNVETGAAEQIAESHEASN